MKLPGWVREPILHFLLLGFALFTAYEWFNLDNSVDSRVIVVDRNSLARFLQFRTKSFAEDANQRLDALTSDSFSDVVNQYIQEEALYRTALSYGMDRQDYVIKRRLVQKMQFMAEGTNAGIDAISEVELGQYYESHRQDYEIPALVTFTHVFFSADRHGNGVDERARETLGILNRDEVRFDQAPNFGERFPYHLNYVERSQEEVAGHFGKLLAEAVFQLRPDKKIWQGPIQSTFGSHLILVTQNLPARVPPLDEVRDRIATEVQLGRERERKQTAINEIVQGFDIEVSQEFETKLNEDH